MMKASLRYLKDWQNFDVFRIYREIQSFLGPLIPNMIVRINTDAIIPDTDNKI